MRKAVLEKVSVMAPIKSYSLFHLDNGRPIVQQFSHNKNLEPSWQYSPSDKIRYIGASLPASLAQQSSKTDHQSSMANSPEDHLSNSQSSWDSSEILQTRLHSMSSVSASSPLSVNMSHDHLLTLGIYTNEAHLLLRIPPEDRFRYRYDTEMSGTHGSLQGKKVGKEKCLPTVELINYPSEALIRVSLVTCNESGERYPHPHSLFVKEKMYQKNIYVNWDNKTLTKTRHYSDPHYIRVGGNKNDYIAKFEGMCIISSKKENFYSSIKEKLLQRSLEHSRGETAYWEGRSDEALNKKAENGVRAVDVDFVSLCFEAFREENDKLVPICQPLYSSPIGNAKSAKTGKLKIARINKCSGSCKGGDEVWMLVEKINKKGLAIRFSEESQGRILWETCVEGDDLILHHQYAIIFKTPPYRDVNITSEVEVTMRLERSSQPAQPCDYSEPMTFVYEPMKNKSTKSENLYRKESMLTPFKQTQNKRPRTDSSSVMSAYNFQNKRKSEDSECPNMADLSYIEQFLKLDELDSYEFGQAWSKFNEEEFRRFIFPEDIDMPLQKDGLSNKNRRELIYKCLRSRLPKLGEAEVKKLTDQISSFRFFKKENSDSKKGFDKVQVEDAASTLLSLRAKAVENINSEDNVSDKADGKAVGSESSSSDYNGNTPLHLFLSGPDNINTKKFEQLIQDFRTCINVKNNEGKTPLHLAVENENLPCLRLLVDHGARINETEIKTERNALHLAALTANFVIFEYLSRVGVDPEACDLNGFTPFHLIQDLPLHHRKQFTSLLHIKKTKREKYSEIDFSENEQSHEMDKIYQILNDSGSWRKLAELWEISFFIPHAEETKNPAKSIFHCAEQKHGRFSLEDLRHLLEGLCEKKAVVIIDEILARKFV